MKRLAFLVLLACSCLSAQGIGGKAGIGGKEGMGGGFVAAAAPTFTQACGAPGAFGTSPSTTIVMGTCGSAINPTAGDILVVWIHPSSAVTGMNTPTGCGTFSLAASDTSTTFQWFYIATATGGGCTISITMTSAGSIGLDAGVHEWSSSSTTQDGSAGYVNDVSGCTSACTGPPVTTTVNNDKVDIFFSDGTMSAMTVTTQDLTNFSSSSGKSISAGHTVQSTPATVTPAWTGSGSSFVAGTIAFKP